MNRLYIAIGEIIKNTQYVEYNLGLMIRCHTILKEFEKSNTVELDRFNQVVEEASKISYELQYMTLGEILRRVKNTGWLRLEEINKLEYVLKNRNYLVHQYFKKNDMEESKGENFIVNELKFLNNILNTIKEVNEFLARIVIRQQKLLDSIE